MAGVFAEAGLGLQVFFSQRGLGKKAARTYSSDPILVCAT
jgi:hypothetical protein